MSKRTRAEDDLIAQLEDQAIIDNRRLDEYRVQVEQLQADKLELEGKVIATAKDATASTKDMTMNVCHNAATGKTVIELDGSWSPAIFTRITTPIVRAIRQKAANVGRNVGKGIKPDKSTVENLQAQIATLEKQNEFLLNDNATKDADLEALQAEMAEIQQQLDEQEQDKTPADKK